MTKKCLKTLHLREIIRGFESSHKNDFLKTCAKYLDKFIYAYETSFE